LFGRYLVHPAVHRDKEKAFRCRSGEQSGFAIHGRIDGCLSLHKLQQAVLIDLRSAQQ
jgi:hypothetical protein